MVNVAEHELVVFGHPPVLDPSIAMGGTLDADTTASAIVIQLSETVSLNVTGKFVTVEFTIRYSAWCMSL